MTLERCRYERTPDGGIAISTSRTVAFLSFIGFLLVVVFIAWFFLKQPKNSKQLLDAIYALRNVFQERSYFFVFITSVALICFLPPLVRNLLIALQGQVFSFDKMSHTIQENGKYVAHFDAVESVEIYEYSGKSSGIGAASINYGLKVLLKDDRKISICKTSNKEKILRIAQDITEFLNIPEPIEKGQQSELVDFIEKWLKRFGMGPY